MKTILLFISIVIIMIFSGCASTYNIEPKYDANNNTLDIVGKIIHDAGISVSNTALPQNSLRFKTKIKKYVSKDELCSDIRYLHQNAGTKAYIWGSLEDKLKEDFTIKSDGECIVEKISNVRFFNCRTLNGYKKPFYGIETKISNQYGYSDLKALFLERRCFHSLVSHFKERAKKDEVEVELYKFTSNKNNNSKSNESSPKIKNKSFIGKFTYSGINKECVKTGDIRVQVNDNTIVGDAIFHNETLSLNGNIDNKLIEGKMGGGTFSGHFNKNYKTIDGTYLTKSCYGSFKLELEK